MTSFASAFGSDHGETNSSIDNHQQSSNHFSNIDLDAQPSSPEQKQHSSYVSLSDAATFRPPDPPIISSTSQDLSSNTTSILNERKISIPDMSKISASSAAAVAAVAPTIDKLKQWGRSTYKCTKQSIYEKLGKTSRTVDVELDTQIEQLRETKRRYENLLALSRSYTNHFLNLLHTQRALSDSFLELKHKSFHLCDEFGYNAETQMLLARHGEVLLNALNFFTSTLDTLCNKTIDDTMNTIRSYEIARLEYDACRTELELIPPSSKLTDKQQELERYKDKYEKLKCDVNIKMKFLDENQTKVMKKQLLLFHNAIAAYFSGNQQALDATMKQFNLKFTSSEHTDQEKKSFLEQFSS